MKRAAIALVLGIPLIASAGPGFGLRKKTIELQVREPARIRLVDASIFFRGSSTNRQYAEVEGSLLATLESELLGNEKTLVKKDRAQDADWLFDIKVTGFSTKPPETRTANKVTFTRWIGSLNAAYQVLDRQGRVHDAGNIAESLNQEYDSARSILSSVPIVGKRDKEPPPASEEDVKQLMIRNAVRKVATTLGNTSKPVEVRLAVGDTPLDLSANFFENRLWQRGLDALQAAQPYSKPEDESYRQYAMALAYEAMAYDSKSFADQRANIFKAAELYDKAVELNPKQEYFIEAVARVKDSIAKVKALDTMAEEDRKRKTAPATATKSTPSAPASGKTLHVNDVIELKDAGVPESEIIDLINNSTLEYDYRDKDAMLAIAKAKLSMRIQNAMRKKVGAPPLPLAETKKK